MLVDGVGVAARRLFVEDRVRSLADGKVAGPLLFLHALKVVLGLNVLLGVNFVLNGIREQFLGR